MIFAKRIQHFYRLILMRVYGYFLPLLLLLGFLTAFMMREPQKESYFNWLEKTTLHRLSGYMLLLILLMVLYDAFWMYFAPKGREARITPREVLRITKELSFPRQVNRVFYIGLSIMAGLGFLSYLTELGTVQGLPSHISLVVWHRFAAWLMLPVIMVKYYFTLGIWVAYLRQLLKRS